MDQRARHARMGPNRRFMGADQALRRLYRLVGKGKH